MKFLDNPDNRMFHNDELLHWIFNHSNQLQFRLTRHHWIKEWLPGYSDFKVEIKVKGASCHGFGIDDNEEMAFIKATSEAIERFCSSYYSLATSTGVAAHTSKEMAAQLARQELIERDAFLCHYLTQTPFFLVQSDDISVGDFSFRKINDKLSKYNIKLEIFQMKCDPAVKSHVCIARNISHPPQFGIIVGLGCDEVSNRAIHKAILECLSNTVSYINKTNSMPIPLEEFFSKVNQTAKNHHQLALHPDSQESILSLIGSPTEVPMNDPDETILDSIEFVDLDPHIEELEGMPLHVIQAVIPLTQPCFYGRTTVEKLNLGRLERFTGREITDSELEFYPHPIG